MRIVLWLLGIPLALIVLAAVLVPLLIDEEALIELAAEEIKATSGVILRVDGEASFSLFPKVALSATEVSVGVPESKTQIKARSFSVGVALMPLLSKSVEIDSILVDGLTLTAEAADEEAAKAAAVGTGAMSNAELDVFYAAREQLRETAGMEAAASVLALPLALAVGELSLRDVRVLTVDTKGTVISEIQLKQLTASDLNLDGRSVPLTAEVLIPGTAGAAPTEITIAAEFTTDLKAEILTLSGLDVRVTGATPDVITLNMSGEVALDTQIADLQLQLDTGDLEGSGTLRFASFESPQINADLALTELNPALLVLAGPEAAAEMERTGSADNADAPLPLHAIRMIDTRAKLRIDTVVLDVHRMTDVQATLRIVDGVATLDPVTAQIYQGDIALKAVFDAHYNQAKFSTEGGLEQLNVGSAVAAMELGVEALGVANLTWSLAGSGATASELTDSLTGPISFSTEDITIANIGMEQMFCKGIALVNQASLSPDTEFPTDTHFEALSADIQLANGVATLNPLTAQLTAVGLNGNGTLDIDSQDLRASFRAQLSPALGELDPACKINERYTDIRWPVECKGNLAGDPADWCGINTAEIVRDLAEGELKRKATNEAGKLFKKLFER